MSVSIKELVSKLQGYSKPLDPAKINVEDLANTVRMATGLLVSLINDNSLMKDVLHSIQTSMKLLGKPEE
jgi:hypothetical protein